MIPVLAIAYLYDAFYRRNRVPAFFQKIPKFLPRLVIALILPLLLYWGWSHTVNTPEYASNYSHFAEVMKAKLEFFNVKPADPAKLSYDARMLWTPSMHSATWDILISFFPSLFFGLRMQFPLFHFIFGYLPVTLGLF